MGLLSQHTFLRSSLEKFSAGFQTAKSFQNHVRIFLFCVFIYFYWSSLTDYLSALVRRTPPVHQLFLRLVFSCFPGGQVAKLFQDSSLGNAVNIVVTRLILLMEDQVNEASDSSLKGWTALSSPVCMCLCVFPHSFSVQTAHNPPLFLLVCAKLLAYASFPSPLNVNGSCNKRTGGCEEERKRVVGEERRKRQGMRGVLYLSDRAALCLSRLLRLWTVISLSISVTPVKGVENLV